MQHSDDKDIATPAPTEDQQSTESVTSLKEAGKTWRSYKNPIAAVLYAALGVGISFAAGDQYLVFLIMYFVGFPFVYLLLRYIWLRLCRDPFLSQR